MVRKRIYSTRELAQVWNLSESTIKRWADTGKLHCHRTPGGHRRFQLEHIHDFQIRHRFEGTGLLTSANWEDPQIEVFVNQKKWDRIRELMLYLAAENQTTRIKDLLERLYIRGLSLVDLYDEVLAPVIENSHQANISGAMGLGQTRLVENNLEEALYYFYPSVISRRSMGKTGLCAAPNPLCTHSVNGISRILNVEGWDSLNLGSEIPFEAMAEIVEQEPVNLVCLALSRSLLDSKLPKKALCLRLVCDRFRIPLLLMGPSFSDLENQENQFPNEYVHSFRELAEYVQQLSR